MISYNLLVALVFFLMCEFLLIVFVGEEKIWTSHSWLFKPIIYFFALNGHKEKVYTKI
jgi:hypothetical protein